MNKISKPMKISLWLTSIGLTFLVASFFSCIANAFSLSFNTLVGGTYSASLYTLMFGGYWNLSGTRSGVAMISSPALIVAFVLMLLALFIIIFIIYGMTCDNINYKHRFMLGIIAVVFLISSSVIFFFIKQFIADAYLSFETKYAKEKIIECTKVSVGVYLVIIFNFISVACGVATAIVSLIAKKNHK